jgi:MerC mercury resistance protein
MARTDSLVTSFDRWAIWLSGLCVAHCLGTAILLGAASAVGGFIENPLIHEIGLALAILFGVVAIGRGIFMHGYMMPPAIGALGLGVMTGALTLPHGEGEIIATIIGVCLLALGHDLNRRAVF